MFELLEKIVEDREKQKRFEFLVGHFLDKCDYHYGSIGTDIVIRNMLLGVHIKSLPPELKNFGRTGVSLRLARALENNMHKKEFEGYNLGRFVPYIRDAYSNAEKKLDNSKKYVKRRY